MIWTDLVCAAAVAALFSCLLALALGWRHPRQPNGAGPSLLFLFVVLLLVLWAAGSWLPPWGPLWGRIPWVSLLLIGLLVSLLILAAGPAAKRPRTRYTQTGVEQTTVVTAFSMFFWIFVWILLTAAIVSYIV